MKKYLKYLYRIYNIVYSYTRAKCEAWHEVLTNQGYYHVIRFEVFTILLTGFLISIALVPFTGTWSPWFSFSYGLVPWLVVQLSVYWKREWKHK